MLFVVDIFLLHNSRFSTIMIYIHINKSPLNLLARLVVRYAEERLDYVSRFIWSWRTMIAFNRDPFSPSPSYTTSSSKQQQTVNCRFGRQQCFKFYRPQTR
uniref:(northern house mosquito) hypothetical protein n=1 Tax=Culex pipiens TaxID=7175 RepID=A0A8D8NDN9_CULPI